MPTHRPRMHEEAKLIYSVNDFAGAPTFGAEGRGVI